MLSESGSEDNKHALLDKVTDTAWKNHIVERPGGTAFVSC